METLENPLVRKLISVADLSEDERTIVAGFAEHTRRVPRRRSIIDEGDQPRYVHLLLEGWAARYKVLPDGSRQITAILVPGDLCDLHIALLAAMDHDIVALTDCTVGFIDSRTLDEVTRTHNTLTRALWWTTLVDEAVLREWVVSSGRRSADEALAHLFCELQARLKIVGLADDHRFPFPLTQEEFGDALGLTPVHVNRRLQVLKGAGLIEQGDGVITVLEPERLQALAGFDSGYLHRRPLAA
jgi:CRP-like cAMP-binding protein